MLLEVNQEVKPQTKVNGSNSKEAQVARLNAFVTLGRYENRMIAFALERSRIQQARNGKKGN